MSSKKKAKKSKPTKKKVPSQSQGHSNHESLHELKATLTTENDTSLLLGIPLGYMVQDADSELSPSFTESMVSFKLKDGRYLELNLQHKIIAENSIIKMKKDSINGDMLRVKLEKLNKGVTWGTIEVQENHVPIQADQSDTANITPEDKISKDMQDNEKNIEEVCDKKAGDATIPSWVKHDFFEKANILVINVYIKQVNNSTLLIQYAANEVSITFQTSDAKFLELNEGTSSSTFQWKIIPRHDIAPEGCSHKVSGTKIEVSLKKVKDQRWGVLEATEKPEKSLSPTGTSTWIPVSEQPSRSSKVIFNELEEVKVSSRSSQSENNQVNSTRDNLQNMNEMNKEKPTCKVSPLNTGENAVVSQGMTGLDNLGNTCFMNASLQVLANTRELRDYFVDGHFSHHINEDNPLGMQGHMAVSFATLLKVLWSGERQSYAPSKLKNLIAKKNSHFAGYAQHDAQEFLAYLLDGLHEDLNRVRKKPYTETVEDKGRPDHVVAEEAWSVYKKRNDSFIVDLFQGQFKSKLVCPECNKVSITFDPFMYVGVPLPKKKMNIAVIFMAKDPYMKPIKMLFQIPKGSSVEQLKLLISYKTNTRTKNLKLFEAYKGRFYKMFNKNSDLSKVQSGDLIIASEVWSEELVGEPVLQIYVIQRTLLPHSYSGICHYCKKQEVLEVKLKRCTKCFRVAYCDQRCQKDDWPSHKSSCMKMLPEIVGCPFIISVPKSQATFSRLCQLMEGFARYSVDTFQPPVKSPSSCSQVSSTASESIIRSGTMSEGPSGSFSSTGNLSDKSSTDGIQFSTDATNKPMFFIDNSDDSSPSLDESSKYGQPSDPIQIVELGSDDSTDGLPVTRGVADPDIISSSSSLDLPSPPSHDPSENNEPVESGYDLNELDSAGLNEATGRTCCTDVNEPTTVKLSEDSSSSNEQNDSANLNESFAKGDADKPGEEVLNQSEDNTVEIESTEDETQKKSKTASVMGIQQDLPKNVKPLFYMKPVTEQGYGISGPEGARLEDNGDEPLDLQSFVILGMDWKNNEKLPAYVLVQSKDLEYEEDESCNTVNMEEGRHITLDHCLNLFTEPERLNPEEAWYCPQCKMHREATKQMSIWKLPHILIVQLKRFSFRNFIWRDKIDTMVDFPMRLDIEDHHDSPTYDLYGVVNHHGSILGGHYTAFTRMPSPDDHRKSLINWRLCDDSRVSFVNEKQVVTRSAYILFYIRRNSSISFPTTVQDNVVTEQYAVTKQQAVTKQLDEQQAVTKQLDDDSDDDHVVPEISKQCDVTDSGDGHVVSVDGETDGPGISYTDMEGVD